MKLWKSWDFPLYFESIAWFSSRLADRAGGTIVLATAMIFFEEPPPGHAVLWSVSVGAAVAPVATRWGSRFIASFGIVDSAQRAMDYLGDVGPVGTCRASWITPPFQIDSIRSNWKIKSFGTPFSIRSDRLAIYFPRPNLQMPSWWFIFLPILWNFKSIH